VLDAEEILPGIMRDDMPDPEEFATVVAELLADARADGRYPRVRIWGEIVDLLWKRGNVTASMSLEDLFDELVARKRECSIFCSFLMDNFDGDVHAQMLPRLGTNHSHLIPVEDYDRLQWAVSGALRDTVGAQEASVLEDRLLSRYRPPFNMPAAQALLLALRQFLPTLADPVLELSRTMYTRSGPSYAHAEQHAH
jgi:hypothetical protein